MSLKATVAFIDDCARVTFRRNLHGRGADFTVYANSGYRPNSRDSEILKHVLFNLLSEGSGVIKVHVAWDTICVFFKSFVSPDEIRDRLEIAVGFAERQFELVG